jgi:hypothetical protein
MRRLLAVCFIFNIHFFNTHFRPEKFPIDTVIFTEGMPLEEVKPDRTREYRQFVEDGKLEDLISRRVCRWPTGCGGD